MAIFDEDRYCVFVCCATVRGLRLPTVRNVPKKLSSIRNIISKYSNHAREHRSRMCTAYALFISAPRDLSYNNNRCEVISIERKRWCSGREGFSGTAAPASYRRVSLFAILVQ